MTIFSSSTLSTPFITLNKHTLGSRWKQKLKLFSPSSWWTCLVQWWPGVQCYVLQWRAACGRCRAAGSSSCSAPVLVVSSCVYSLCPAEFTFSPAVARGQQLNSLLVHAASVAVVKQEGNCWGFNHQGGERPAESNPDFKSKQKLCRIAS